MTQTTEYRRPDSSATHATLLYTHARVVLPAKEKKLARPELDQARLLSSSRAVSGLASGELLSPQ